jgi:dihydrofolate reductase
MTIVTAQMSVSADGFYAGPLHAGPQATWLESTEALGFFRVTRWAIDAEAWRQRMRFTGGEQNTNSEVISETFARAGAYVMGRRMFEGGEIPWGDDPPFRAPVFVVTRRPRPVLHRQGGTSFTFVTDGIESAIDQARAVATGKNVAIAGGGTLVRDPRGRDAPAQPRARPRRRRGDRADPRARRRLARRHPHPLLGQRPPSACPRQQGTRGRASDRLSSCVRVSSSREARALPLARASCPLAGHRRGPG